MGALGPRVAPVFYERLGEGYQWTSKGTTTILTPALPGFPPLTLTYVAAGPPNNRLPRLLHWGEPGRDAATGLPTRFTLHLPTEKAPLGELEGHYNLPLPAELLTPTPSRGPTLDLAELLHALSAQTNTFAGQGLTVHATLLAQDSVGNLRARLELTPKQPGLPEKLPFGLENLRVAGLSRPKPVSLSPLMKKGKVLFPVQESGGGGGMALTKESLVPRGIHDDQAGSYTLTFLPRQSAGTFLELYFVRLTPRPAGAPLPKTVTFFLDADQVWLPAFRPYFDPAIFHTVHQQLTLTVPASLPTELPSPETKLKFDEARKLYHTRVKSVENVVPKPRD